MKEQECTSPLHGLEMHQRRKAIFGLLLIGTVMPTAVNLGVCIMWKPFCLGVGVGPFSLNVFIAKK